MEKASSGGTLRLARLAALEHELEVLLRSRVRVSWHQLHERLQQLEQAAGLESDPPRIDSSVPVGLESVGHLRADGALVRGQLDQSVRLKGGHLTRDPIGSEKTSGPTQTSCLPLAGPALVGRLPDRRRPTLARSTSDSFTQQPPLYPVRLRGRRLGYSGGLAREAKPPPSPQLVHGPNRSPLCPPAEGLLRVSDSTSSGAALVGIAVKGPVWMNSGASGTSAPRREPGVA